MLNFSCRLIFISHHNKYFQTRHFHVNTFLILFLFLFEFLFLFLFFFHFHFFLFFFIFVLFLFLFSFSFIIIFIAINRSHWSRSRLNTECWRTFPSVFTVPWLCSPTHYSVPHIFRFHRDDASVHCRSRTLRYSTVQYIYFAKKNLFF